MKCFSSASFSGFLSIAAYICHNYPHLGPPGCPKVEENYIDEDEFPSTHLSFNKYFEPWCDFFNTLLDEKEEYGYITEKENVLYLLCKVQ